jgi:hypothetical protein
VGSCEHGDDLTGSGIVVLLNVYNRLRQYIVRSPESLILVY